MNLSPLEKILIVFAVVLTIISTTAFAMYRHAISERRTAALHADSLAAALDTSHLVALSKEDSIRILGDTIRAVGRRIFQVPQHDDALDKALNLQRVAIANLSAQVQALSARLTSSAPVTVNSETGERSASFAVDTIPYHGTATAYLPVSGPGRLDLSIHLDSAAIGLRLGCGAARDGVRAASVTLTGPTWLALSAGRVEQSPEICNPTSSRPSLWRRLFAACGVGPSGSIIFAEDRKIHVGFGASASCHAWP